MCISVDVYIVIRHFKSRFQYLDPGVVNLKYSIPFWQNAPGLEALVDRRKIFDRNSNFVKLTIEIIVHMKRFERIYFMKDGAVGGRQQNTSNKANIVTVNTNLSILIN